MVDVSVGDVLNWNLEQLYNFVKTLEVTEGELSEEDLCILEMVRSGDNCLIPIHINYLIKEYYVETPKNGTAKIVGLGKCDIKEFWKDLDYRSGQLRRIALDYIVNDKLIEGRTI